MLFVGRQHDTPLSFYQKSIQTYRKIIKIYCNHSAYFNVLNHGLLVIHSTQIPGNTSHVGIECPLGDLAVRFHLDVLSQTANGLSS